MKQKIISFLLILTLIVAAIPLSGIDFSDLFLTKASAAPYISSSDSFNGEYYYHNNGVRVQIKKYMGSAENIEIPSHIDGVPVTVIGEGAFTPRVYEANRYFEYYNNENCINIKTVKIPATVTTIESSVFLGCSNLTSIEIPDSVQYLNNAFSGCNSLKSINFPASMKQIPSSMFSQTAFEEVVFKKNTETDYFRIYNLAFNKSEVKKCTIQSDNVIVGNDAFYGSHLKEVVFEGSIHGFSETAVSTLGNTIDKIYFYSDYPSEIDEILTADYGYYRHENESYVCFSKTADENGTIQKFDGFSYILDGDEVTITGYEGKTDSIYIPEKINGYNVTAVGEGALGYFYYTDDYVTVNCLKSVFIPSTVKRIEKNAFANNYYLTTVTVYGNSEGSDETETEHNLEYIGDSAFYQCSVLYEFDIPSTVKIIEDKAFYDCREFASCLRLPSVEYIGNSAFENCENLSMGIEDDEELESELRFMLSDYMTGIGEKAFKNCYQINKIKLPEGITEIKPYTFYGNMYLKEITLPESVETIGEYAFAECWHLETVSNTENVKELGRYAFFRTGNDNVCRIDFMDFSGLIGSVPEYCFSESGLKEITISENVKKIDKYAFSACPWLLTVNWSSDSKTVDEYAFYECEILRDFDFINVIKLYRNSFYGTKLKKVALGVIESNAATPINTVTAQSFKSCADLEIVSIGGTIEVVETQAFADCTNLETAVISDSVTDIADDAFEGCDSLVIYCSETSYACSYAMARGISVSTFIIDEIPNQTYTGYQIKPSVSVSTSNGKLSENIDYSVSFSNNVNVGNAKVTVTGKGDYNAFKSVASFTIVTRSIKAAKVSAISTQNFKGEKVEPKLTITYNGLVLKEGKDYNLQYINNNGEGTGLVYITGIGNFSGSDRVEFEIRELSASESFANALLDFFNSFFTILKSIFSK